MIQARPLQRTPALPLRSTFDSTQDSTQVREEAPPVSATISTRHISEVSLCQGAIVKDQQTDGDVYTCLDCLRQYLDVTGAIWFWLNGFRKEQGISIYSILSWHETSSSSNRLIDRFVCLLCGLRESDAMKFADHITGHEKRDFEAHRLSHLLVQCTCHMYTDYLTPTSAWPHVAACEFSLLCAPENSE